MTDATTPSSSPSGVYLGSASGSFQSSRSGLYVSRPSIARSDVLSDHQLYLDEHGEVTGVFVVTAAPGELGAPITLDVHLPWGEVLEVAGDVDWVLDVPRASLRHRPGMGVRLDLNPGQRALLQRAMLLRDPMAVPAGVRRR